MIKGTSKRVIVVKHPDTELFEEAYFIVKDKRIKSKSDTKSLIVEAGRIINTSCTEEEKKSKRKRGYERLLNVLSFLSGMLFAVVVFYILTKI